MEVKNKDSPIVYICSPYSGDVSGNLDRACRYSRFAVDEGCVPITPHLYLPLFAASRLRHTSICRFSYRKRRNGSWRSAWTCA